MLLLLLLAIILLLLWLILLLLPLQIDNKLCESTACLPQTKDKGQRTKTKGRGTKTYQMQEVAIASVYKQCM